MPKKSPCSPVCRRPKILAGPASQKRRTLWRFSLSNRCHSISAWRKHDIAGSIAHATMLHSAGLLSKKDLNAIKNGLSSILADIQAEKFRPDIAQEDIHMAVEAELIKRIGEPGKRLHTGRSRNDQVALDIRLWCREAIQALHLKINDVQHAFVKMASEQGHHPMPSYTHLQRAQPVVAGHEMLAYCEMLDRDKQRPPGLLADASTSPRWARAPSAAARCPSTAPKPPSSSTWMASRITRWTPSPTATFFANWPSTWP